MGTRRSRHNKGRKPLYKEHGDGLAKDAFLNEAVMNPLPPSMLPQVCIKCGGPCSFSSRLRKCRACYRADKAAGLHPNWNKGAAQPQKRIILPHVLPAETLLAAIPEGEHSEWNSYLHWSNNEDRALVTLIGANASPEQVGRLLRRPTTKVVHHAISRGLKIPKNWRTFLPYYKPPKYTPEQRAAMRAANHSAKLARLAGRRIRMQPLLQFPYVKRVTSETEQLLLINSLVPRTFSEDQRADIVQGIMLAVFEGTVKIEEIENDRKLVGRFIKEFYQEQRPWQEITGFGNEDDARPYDERAARIEEWHPSEEDDASRNYEAVSALSRPWVKPTQEDDVARLEYQMLRATGVENAHQARRLLRGVRP